jgi:hypothetical protein
MSNNTKLGTGALQKNSGNNNTGIGAYASYDNTSSFNNTAVGSNSSFFNTTGANNTSIGAGSMCNNTTGSLNTAVGSSALEGTTPATSVGINNVAVGVQALYKNSADNNTGVGSYSLISNTSGTSNTGIGYQSLYKNTTANNNTALGFQALYDNTTAANNTAVGYLSLADTTAANNTAIGYQSLGSNTTGTNNTAVGQDAGNTNQTGQYNTYIGAGADANASNYSNSTALGYGATITSSNQIVIGTLAENVYIEGDAFLPNFVTATSDDQIVPKSYVDSVAAGLNITQTCVCATTANINLGSPVGSTVTIPLSTTTDNYDLAANVAIGDSVFILVVSQGSSSTPTTPPTLTDDIDNGVYIFTNSGSGNCTITRPVSPPMNSGFNATGAFSFIENGTSYAKTGLVQSNGPSALVGTASLQYQLFYQFKFEVGQGLNVTSSGGNNYLNVDSSLDFLTLVDASSSSPTLNIGTTNATTINMGKSNGATTTNLTGILDVTGTANISSDATVGGTLNVTGITTLGTLNASSVATSGANITGGTISSTAISGGTIDGTAIGGTTAAAGTFTTLTANTSLSTGVANITGGAIDGTIIGGTTAAAGTFTTLTANTSLSTGVANITGGAIDGTIIGGSTPAAGSFTTLSTSGLATLNSLSTSGLATLNSLSTSGLATLNSLSTTGADINGGTIDGTIIGASTPAAGSFTTLSTSGLATLNSLSTSGLATLNSASVTTTLGVTGATTLSNTLTVQNSAGKINLINSTSGANNLAIGQNSQNSITSGIRNHSFGIGTLYSNTIGQNNSAFGFNTLYSNIDGSNNTAFGYEALYTNTSGYENSAFGVNSLVLNTSGYYNSAFGVGSLAKNTSGNNNNSFGRASLNNNTTGYTNNAFGTYALQVNSTGFDNCAFGHASLENTNANANSAFGSYSLQLTTGTQNCAVGYYSLNNSTNTSINTAIGSQAGRYALTPSSCTFLGALTDFDVSSNNYSQSTAVGYNAKITASNQIMLGTSAQTVQIPGALTVTGASTLGLTTISTATINGGSINGTTIGGTTPSTGAFTTLTTSGLATLNSASVGGALTVTGNSTFNGSIVGNSSSNILQLINNYWLKVQGTSGGGAINFWDQTYNGGQGSYIGWNLATGGTGETDFVCNKGNGGGGFNFYIQSHPPDAQLPQNPIVTIDGTGNLNTTTGYITSAGPYWRSSYNPITIGAGSNANVVPVLTGNDFSSGITIASTNYLQIPTGAYGIYSVTFVANTDSFTPPGVFQVSVNQNTTASTSGATTVLETETYITSGGSTYQDSLTVTGLINYSSSNLRQYLYFNIGNGTGSSANFAGYAPLTAGVSFAYICVHKVA